MERNTLTIIYHLKIGDRFYKLNDPKKEVWEKTEPENRRTVLHYAKKDNQLFPVSFKSNMEVIFLRHAKNEL